MQRSALLALAASLTALSAGVRAAGAPPSPVPPTITAPSATAAAPNAPAPSPAPAATAASHPAPTEASEEVRVKGGEPVVKRTVIEDGQTRIEELRVRGNLQKVTVAPKGRAPGYEILTGDGYHATAEDPGTSRGSAGKRVWNVLRF